MGTGSNGVLEPDQEPVRATAERLSQDLAALLALGGVSPRKTHF